MRKLFLLISIFIVSIVNAADMMIPKFQESFYNQNSEKALSTGMEILATASSQPAAYGSDYNGRISSSNNVPYFIGLITSQRDNQNYSGWKQRLEQTYANSPQGLMKSIAALALSRMGDKIAITDLEPLLGEEDNEVLRSLAIRELGKSGDPAAIPILEGILNGKEVPAVEFVSGEPKYFYPIKSAAEKALKELGVSSPPGASSATAEDVIKQLGEYLNQDLGVALAAAHSLTHIGTPEALAVMETYAKEHKADIPPRHVVSDINVRLSALKKKRQAQEGTGGPGIGQGATNNSEANIQGKNSDRQSAIEQFSSGTQAPSSSSFPIVPVAVLALGVVGVLVVLFRRKRH